MALAIVSVAAPSIISAQDRADAESAIKKQLLWEVNIPFVGCVDGSTLSNVQLPKKNPPVPACGDKRAPDVLSRKPQLLSGRDANSYEMGTVIVVGVSHEKVVVAADSRYVKVRGKRTDGSPDVIGYNDKGCKLIQLTPTLLFAADGQVAANAMGTLLYDAHSLARQAARSYRPDSRSTEEQLAGGMIEAIATRWAWDVDYRVHQGFARGWKPIQILEGIFVGLEADGETAFVVARLEYPKPRPDFTVPQAFITIGRFKELPTDFTWIEAFGVKDVAEQTKANDKEIGAEILRDPQLFDDEVPEWLVNLTIEHYETLADLKAPLFVHGPVDSAVLQRKGKITWIHAKGCSVSGSAVPR